MRILSDFVFNCVNKRFYCKAQSINRLRESLSTGPSLQDFISESIENYKDVRIISSKPHTRLPQWLKTDIPSGENVKELKNTLRGLELHTVCEEARCPNISECWGGREGTATATIMLLGGNCTRGCRFCSVRTSRTPAPPDPDEPEKTARAIASWNLGYIVITTVDRDDLVDFGSSHIAKTIQLIKKYKPEILVEALVGDCRGETNYVERIAGSGLDVFAHNIETVERLTPYIRDRRAGYRQSLNILEHVKNFNNVLTKTSIMLGFGEDDKDILQTLQDARNAGVDAITLGQYMRPTKNHLKVEKYVSPEEFDYWKRKADELGFLYCASGPLVRSSYKAGEFYLQNIVETMKKKNP